MKPTDILKKEHELILTMLRIIDSACTKIENGEKVTHDHMSDMIDFIQNFADKCHHAKEENILFPALEKAGIARGGGPIDVMMAEHVMGRTYAKGMDEAVSKMKEGDDGASEMFVQDAQGYIDLLDGHIMKENNVLFAMADEHINGDVQKKIIEGFERVERDEIGAGVHEKYHDMLKRLSDVYLG
jgi:hemerythrin-like domain-containing protein